MWQCCVKNLRVVRALFLELLCKQSDILTDFRVYSFFFLSTQKESNDKFSIFYRVFAWPGTPIHGIWYWSDTNKDISIRRQTLNQRISLSFIDHSSNEQIPSIVSIFSTSVAIYLFNTQNTMFINTCSFFNSLSLVSRDSSRKSNEHKTEKKCHGFPRIAIALFKLFVRGKHRMSIVIKMQCVWHHPKATTSWKLLLIVSDLISFFPQLFIGANRLHSMERDCISLKWSSQSDSSQISWIEMNWDD